MVLSNHFLISLEIAAAFGVGGWLAYRRSPASCGAVFSAYFALTLLLVYPPLLVMHMAAFGVVLFACGVRQAKPRTFGLSLLMATFAVIGVRGAHVYERSVEVAQLRREYPVQSLTERLAYETRRIEPATGKPAFESRTDERRLTTGSAIDAAQEVSARGLKELEEEVQSQPWRRRRSLPALLRAHEGVVNEFTEREGFGVVRTRDLPARREFIELPEPQPVPLPRPDATGSGSADADDDFADMVLAPAGHELTGRAALENAHRRGIADFANPESTGYVGYSPDGDDWKPDLDRVVGFQAHAFRSIPEVDAPSGGKWEITELQLVSLLKHDPPAAYLSQNLPRMEELREALTRPLDEFELSSLGKLRDGEELVIAERGNALRMFGAIRAARQCLECHRVPRGGLLGAFSYRLMRNSLQRDKAPAAPKAPRGPVPPPA